MQIKTNWGFLFFFIQGRIFIQNRKESKRLQDRRTKSTKRRKETVSAGHRLHIVW